MFRDVSAVIASEARQPRCRAWGCKVRFARTPPRKVHDALGCFAALAMTAETSIRLPDYSATMPPSTLTSVAVMNEEPDEHRNRIGAADSSDAAKRLIGVSFMKAARCSSVTSR